jgi:GntR family transcriptional regulator
MQPKNTDEIPGRTSGQNFGPSRQQPMPLYFQVYETLRRQITDGVWRKGDLIPAIPVLTRQFKVAAITVRQAIRLLQDDGLVLSERGRGTTVIADISAQKPLYLESSVSHLLDIYAGDRPELMTFDEGVAAPPLYPHDMKLASSYYFLTRAHIRDDMRYCLITMYIEETIFRANEAAFREKLALPVLCGMQDEIMARAWQTLRIEKADLSLAAHLKIPHGEPIARVQRFITDARDRLIYFADISYRSDCVQYSMELKI